MFRYDAQTRSGSVITDQGLLLPFASPAMDASGLRHLRPGQRLTIQTDDETAAVLALSLGSIVPT